MRVDASCRESRRNRVFRNLVVFLNVCEYILFDLLKRMYSYFTKSALNFKNLLSHKRVDSQIFTKRPRFLIHLAYRKTPKYT